jgi:serine phosphatase RsbU (regulator of sigma subunit)
MQLNEGEPTHSPSQPKRKGRQGIYEAFNEWRSTTVTTMLKVVAVFGCLSLVALFLGAYKEPQRLPSVLFFLGTYLVIVGLVFIKRFNWQFRAWIMLFITYMVGIISLARGGLAGAGRDYLIIIPILATVLISIRAGMLSAILSLLVMLIFSFLVDAGFFQEVMIYQQNPRDLGVWVEEITYSAVLMGIATALVILFHRYVLRILLAERKTSQKLEQARAILEEYNQTLEEKVSQRTSELAQAYKVVEQSRQRMERELAMAGKIQACFMSQELPHISGWQCTGLFVPARETTGDFYYLAPCGNQRYGILIADVVDKGIGAALLMSFCWGLVHTFTSQHPDRPDWIARKLHQGLYHDTHAGQFVTLFYGLLDTSTHEMEYINAGHNPPLLFCRSKRSVQMLKRTGLPLGIFPTQSWNTECAHFSPGDCLLLYTDGVTDAENPAHEQFGSPRLIELVSANLEKPAIEIQDTIIRSLNNFTEKREPFDDLTLLVLQREISAQVQT